MSIIIDSKNPKNLEEKQIVDIIEKTIDMYLEQTNIKEGEK